MAVLDRRRGVQVVVDEEVPGRHSLRRRWIRARGGVRRLGPGSGGEGVYQGASISRGPSVGGEVTVGARELERSRSLEGRLQGSRGGGGAIIGGGGGALL